MNDISPDQFTKVMDFNIIELFKDKKNNEALKILYPKNAPIWIFNIINNYSDEELDSNRYLTYLVAYYLKKLEKDFSEFFMDYGVKPNNMEFYVFPESYYKKNQLNYPDFELTSNINVKINFIQKKQSYRVILVHNIEIFNKNLSSETNDCERYTIKKLVERFFYQFWFDLPHENVKMSAKLFVDKAIPYGIKNIESYLSFNKRLLSYLDPIETSEVELKKFYPNFKDFLKENEIKSGSYSGLELNKLIKKIYGFIQLTLESEISKLNKEFIYFIYIQLEYLLNQNECKELVFGQNSGKQKHNREKLINEKIDWFMYYVSRNSAIMHLIETTLRVCPQGKKEFNVEDFQYLESLSDLAVYFATISDKIYFNLGDYSLKINENYSFEWNIDESNIDVQNHMMEYNKIGLNIDTIKHEAMKYSEHNNISKNDSSHSSSKFINLDKAFEMDLGFKFNELLRTLFILTILEPPKDNFYPLICIDEECLVNKIKEELYLSNKDQIDSLVLIKILNYLSIDPQLLKEIKVFLPSSLKMNMNRFTIRPLIKFKKENKTFYMYGIRSVFWTARIYFLRVCEGRFPYNVVDKENINNEIKLIKKAIENNLEKKLDNKLAEIFSRNFVESRLNNFHRIDNSLPKRPDCGEIDSLAVDKENKIIYVLEAKYVKTGIVPQEFSNEIKKFFYPPDGKNYANMLQKKGKFVSDNIKVFLKYFKIPYSDGWKIKTAFVTCEVHISASLAENKINFIPLSQLEEYLKN